MLEKVIIINSHFNRIILGRKGKKQGEFLETKDITLDTLGAIVDHFTENKKNKGSYTTMQYGNKYYKIEVKEIDKNVFEEHKKEDNKQ